MSSDYSFEAPVPPADPWDRGGQNREPLPVAPASPGWREWIVPAFLFFTTFLSVTFAGLFQLTGDLSFFQLPIAVLRHPTVLLQGLPFSFTFISILLAHELGHFFACRYYAVRCTPPFFLPFPVSIAGTLGAFIRIKSSFPNKRALFDVGIAGPLAGFLFTVPALVIGIAWSRLVPRGSLHGSMGFGEPLLFRWIGKLVLGYAPQSQDMLAHPIAMAAWFGLLVTSLNLLPIWQLDGGHISYAILGRERQKTASIASAVLLMALGLAEWRLPSYLLFAMLILIMGMRYRFYHPPTLFDEQDLGTGRRLLAAAAMMILVISFTPVPVYFD